MFDIGATELLVIVIVAILAIGPKDMPLALRTVGRWIGKMRRVSGHFRASLDAMIRDAELEDMEREWRERNAQIMKSHPQDAEPARLAEPLHHGAENTAPSSASAEARVAANATGVARVGGDDNGSDPASSAGQAADDPKP